MKLCILPVLAVLTVGCGSGEQDLAVPIGGVLRVGVTGYDYSWVVSYPESGSRMAGESRFRSSRILRLPARSEVEIVLNSEDYLYVFELPDLGVKEIAVPGLPFTVRFRTGGIGTQKLLGNQMCGYDHPDLLGNLVVQERGEFFSWRAKQ